MSKKVLLADDSPTVLTALQQVLTGRGLMLLLARNGHEALALAIAERPTLILMDVTMPQLDGLEATRRVRGVPELRRTPIILVTSRNAPVDMLEGFKAGCDLYITKPFNALRLRGLVSGFLAREEALGSCEREDTLPLGGRGRRPSA